MRAAPSEGHRACCATGGNRPATAAATGGRGRGIRPATAAATGPGTELDRRQRYEKCQNAVHMLLACFRFMHWRMMCFSHHKVIECDGEVKFQKMCTDMTGFVKWSNALRGWCV